MTPERTAFLAAEKAYQKACKGLYVAAGATNADLATQTRIEIAARAYADAADAYRSATRAYMSATHAGHENKNTSQNDDPPTGGS